MAASLRMPDVFEDAQAVRRGSIKLAGAYGCRNSQELWQHKYGAPRMICRAIGMASEWSGLFGSDGESVEKH